MPEIVHLSNEEQPKVPEPEKPAEPVSGLSLRPDVEFSLPDGRKIRMGKPAIPTAMLLPSIIAGMNDPERKSDAARNEFNARMSLFVRSIDGKPFSPPSSAAEVGLILQQLGEDGCDLVLDVYFRHFAPLSADKLEIIKK